MRDQNSLLQVFTSDHALKLEWIPDWVAIIGSGYIGLEFSDVYTALGSEVTFIEVKAKLACLFAGHRSLLVCLWKRFESIVILVTH